VPSLKSSSLRSWLSLNARAAHNSAGRAARGSRSAAGFAVTTRPPRGESPAPISRFRQSTKSLDTAQRHGMAIRHLGGCQTPHLGLLRRDVLSQAMGEAGGVFGSGKPAGIAVRFSHSP